MELNVILNIRVYVLTEHHIFSVETEYRHKCSACVQTES
jgi:hypothetical protein